MLVNVKKLRDNLDRFSTVTNEYYYNYTNLYNEINNSKSYYNSAKATNFYNACDLEKVSNDDLYNDIDSLKKVYKYICEHYSGIGNTIEFELGNSTALFNQIKEINNKINTIRRSLNEIDTSMAREIYYAILEIDNRLNSMQKNLQELERGNKNTINKINDIEKNVKNKLSKIDVGYINETDIRPFM